MEIKNSNFKTIFKTKTKSVNWQYRQEKCKPMKGATEYCITNNCKGFAAFSTSPFTLIKDPHTINRWRPAMIEKINQKLEKKKINYCL